jgi:hypothetical protein
VLAKELPQPRDCFEGVIDVVLVSLSRLTGRFPPQSVFTNMFDCGTGDAGER